MIYITVSIHHMTILYVDSQYFCSSTQDVTNETPSEDNIWVMSEQVTINADGVKRDAWWNGD